jgi:hypothetical protein
MKRWLARPRIESREPATRRDAVLHDDVETLGKPLADIAREDVDASVRLAALRRAADIALAHERALDDGDDSVKNAARTLYLDLLAGTHAAAPAPAERLRLLAGVDDDAVLEHLARHGDDAALREAALARLTRPALVAERALDDPDAELRLRLVDRIDDTAALERLAERARRQDKRVHHAARRRVLALRIAAGDRDAVLNVAEELCSQLEQAVAAHADSARIVAIDAEWRALGNDLPPALATRYAHAQQQHRAAIAALDVSVQPITSAPPQVGESEAHPSATVEPPSDAVQRLAAMQRFQASLAVGREYAPARTSPPPRQAASELLHGLEQALDRGDLATASMLEKQLRDEGEPRRGDTATRWQQAVARLHELQRWQQWSNRRQRRQLCTDVRALHGSGLHPDALATRVQELREAWRRIDALDQGDAALRHRFEALCQQALSPAQAYFKQRQSLRKQHGEEVRALLDAPDGDDGDFRVLETRRRQLAAARRGLDAVAPGERKRLARALGERIDAIDTRLASHYAEVDAGHRALIAEAGKLAELPPAQRAAAARALQSRWKSLGSGRRDLDREQWQAFRTECDAVFAELDRQRHERDAAAKAATAQAQSLLDELHAADGDSAEALENARRDLQRRWRALPDRDRNLERRWQEAQQHLDQRVAALRQSAWRDQRRAVLDALQREDAAVALPDDVPAPLRDALRRRSRAPADPQQARDLLIRVEALAGLDSPAEDGERRMQLKLERLRAALGEGRRGDRGAELDELLAAWIRLGPLPDASTGIAQRFERAATALLEAPHAQDLPAGPRQRL